MNLPQLYYFRKLAEVEHYTRAAKELFITQPSLSDSISSLERELGIQLFQKKGRNVQLTKYGREFYEYVSESLGILEHGIAMMKEGAGHAGGSVDVGCIPTLLGDFLPDVVFDFNQANPQVQLNVHQDMSIEVAKGVSEGRYDIGFCSMVEKCPDLVFVPITYQELIVIVNTEHPLASAKELRLEDLRGHTLTTYRDTIPIGKIVRKLLKEKGVEAAYAYDDEISIGGRISKFPRAAIVADTPFLKQFDNLVKIKLPDVPKDIRMIYMVYSKENFTTAAVEAFANFVVAHELRLP